MTLRVSDHALVRFLDRSGLPVETIRVQLAASLDRAAVAAERVGADDYEVHADQLVYVVRAGVVVTIKPDDRRR